MAAGYSSRAGEFKLAWSLAGKSLIERTIESMSPFCARIIVVGGHRVEEITALTRDYAQVEVVFNKDYRSGMFSSVKTGVAHLQGKRFFLLPGDHPLVAGEVYRKLLQVEADIVIPTFKGRKGHPVLIKSALADEILQEPADSNLRAFIRRRGFELVEVEDSGILVDIDTREEYERIKQRSLP